MSVASVANAIGLMTGSVLVGLDLTGEAAPEIDVRGKDSSIPDGDDTPSTQNGTDFGYAATEGGEVEHTFTIANTGPGALYLTSTPRVTVTGPHAGDFTVTEQPPVAAVNGGGGTTTFTVRFDPSATGTRSASLEIDNNDGDENPFTFDVQGHGQAGTAIGGAGGEVAHGRWSVTIPPDAVPDGSTIFLESGLMDVGPPVGEGLEPLGNIMELHLYNAAGVELVALNPPLEVCAGYTPADVVTAGGNPANLHIATAPDGASVWTLLETTVDEERQQVCAEVEHLSYFEVMYPALPGTGFAPNVVTTLPPRPPNLHYPEKAGIQLHIPRLGIRQTIASVPFGAAGWDIRWLGDGIGYLEGTAFPTWAGNTALTGHIYLSDGTPGPFVNLASLRWGDEIIISAWGEAYTYRVGAVEYVAPGDLSVLGHEEGDVLTLLTCRGYDEGREAYRWRVVVKAALVSVSGNQ